MTLEKKLTVISDVVIFIGAAAGLYLFLKLISGALFPFAFAAATAIALSSTARKLSAKYKIKRKYAAVFVVCVLYISLTAAFFAVILLLYKQIVSVSALLPEYSEKVMEMISKLVGAFGIFFPGAKEGGAFGDSLPMIFDSAAEWILRLIKGVAVNLPLFFLSAVVTVAASFYLCRDYDKITAFFVYILPEGTAKKLSLYKSKVTENISAMLKSYFVIMFITFCEVFAGLLALGVKNALLIAILTAIIDFLPVLGSGTVLIPLGVITAVGGGTVKGVGIFVLYIVITAVRYFAEPKIVGKAVGIHPLLMLAAVFFGFELFGASGIILLPVALLIAKCILDEYIILRKTAGK